MKNRDKWKLDFNQVLLTRYHRTFDEATPKMVFAALSEVLMQYLSKDWVDTQKKNKDRRQAFYLSAEFLMGRSLINNLMNADYYETVEALLDQKGISLNDLEALEPDAALGNGGLGRLAACFLDSAATHALPLTGYGIYYDYGLFKQQFIDGAQVELPDEWSEGAELWCVKKVDEGVIIEFGGQRVKAIPYDMPVVGFGVNTINSLRLWKSEAMHVLDLDQFHKQDYSKSLKERNNAEIISMILYPNDSTDKGKTLRLKQEYFFVSASLQDMMRQFEQNGHLDFKNFCHWHAVQLNDTHPAVAIPELIRLLINRGLDFEDAFLTAQRTFSYTNHTILAEALEKWSVKLFAKVLPQLYPIVKTIQERLVNELVAKGIEKSKFEQYAISDGRMINMAWLSIYGSHHVNGVAELHTKILKEKELKHWYAIYPERFINVTNGVTQRRWLKQSNPELSELISHCLNSERWMTYLEELQKLEVFVGDDAVIKAFIEIKNKKKKHLADYIFKKEGIVLLEDAIYDIQIKRMHEYKRQLLNGLHIYDLYRRIKANPHKGWPKRVFIFGAKAAPGYKRAKAVIRFIHWIGTLISNDPLVSPLLQVVFVENYSVSYAEKLFPAADFSEQISTAGTEASGTGNMKFMINGTVTIGTYDGANVEIAHAVGNDNIIIFGETVESLKAIAENYDPKALYESVEGLKEAVDALLLVAGHKDEDLAELHESLLNGAHWHKADHYYVLKDFQSYQEAHEKAAALYSDPMKMARVAWINMCRSGRFSSDQSIRIYAKEIWKIE